MDIKDVIFSLLDKQGKTARELGEYIGVKPSSISAWKNENSYPSSKLIVRISEFFGVSPTYLCTGIEDSKKSDLTDGDRIVLEQLKKLSEHEKMLFAGMISYTSNYADRISGGNSSKPVPFEITSYKLRSLRVFDMPSSAGTGLYLDSDDYTTMEFDKDIIPQGADFGVRIRGDSMIPFVSDDDIVFVKSQPELEDGEIGIVVLNNNALCKKYCVRDGKVFLVSLNPKYEPIELKEYDELHCVGKVVGRVTPEENTKA